MAPLTTTPGRQNRGPSWARSASLLAAALITGIITLIVWTGRGFVLDVDQPIVDWLSETAWLDRLGVMDPFGSTVITIGLVVLIGMSAFRCRVMAVLYPVAFVLAWGSTLFLQELIDRPRPTGLGEPISFPSGHMVQAVFIAGLVPLALQVLLSDDRIARLTRVVLSVAVVGSMVHRIHRLDHWPVDALGGIALGLTIVLFVHWTMEHTMWHQRCDSCPWSGHPDHVHWTKGVFDVSPAMAHLLDRGGVALALGSAAALVIATLVVGFPTDPEGAGFGSAIVEPVQITFAVLLGVAGLVSLRWKGVAAFIMVVVATGLGLATSVEYAPWLAITLTAALMIPAVMIWFAWQPHETIGSIAVLAAITVIMLTTTAFGSREIYGYYFGPTHPDSRAAALESEADWFWLGAVDADSAVVVAGGLDPGSTAELAYWDLARTDDSAVVESLVDNDGLARFGLSDLNPDSAYGYAVVGTESATRSAEASFETHDEGAQNLVIVVGSCARRTSNGAVFDQIVAEDPDLYIAIGDLHYGNIDSAIPSDHIREYGRSLSQPAQASLFSSVPTAYVWDDHDYGPNDAGASSPSRDAVSEAYRRAVPHSGVDEDPAASIAQAFTIGRVRVVMSDTRSHRTESTMLGEEQLAWLIDELTMSSRNHALVVWANPTPWISDDGLQSDNWSAHPEERRIISEALAAADIENIVMVSGDAHMVAIDDGSNTGYASDGSLGFPLLHAAALDRPGSVKGGPYSEGAFPGGGQFGKLEVFDDGGPEIRVRLSGKDWTGDELVAWEQSIAVPPTALLAEN